MDSTDGVIGIAGGRELIDFEHLLDRMLARFPHLSRVEIHTAAMIEHDAITGGALYAVPAELEDGLIEALEASGEATEEPSSAA